jgi:hypothetical protein
MVELDINEVQTEGMYLALVGAGIGGGLANTNELKVMNYLGAMQSPDKIKNEFERLKNAMSLLWCHTVTYQVMQRLCL